MVEHACASVVCQLVRVGVTELGHALSMGGLGHDFGASVRAKGALAAPPVLLDELEG